MLLVLLLQLILKKLIILYAVSNYAELLDILSKEK